mmetsp:Transcript_29019/g.81751  ORF Transcript_29019/g.81751 Transcript_29019/m.81751 type:complete len:694 (-) Transcript_29019:246-2327(-)
MSKETVLSVLSEPQKRVLAVALLFGGSYAVSEIKAVLKAARREQSALAMGVAADQGRPPEKRSKALADKVFLARLLKILSVCVPSIWSKEAGLIFLQGTLLISRTILTEVVSTLEGRVGRHIMNANWPRFANTTLAFAAVGVPAAVVNAALKYMQKQIQLSLSSRLTRHLHEKYCGNRAFYAASVLGGLTHADQRITEDVENFCFSVSELYSYTFKPLLDVILFTRTLSKNMGYRAQFALYSYYFAAGALLKATAPPLARMVAQESALTGSFRAAHQRLVTHAEEVAFNDPPAGATEEMILNQHHSRLVRYSQLSSLQRFFQQINDQYFIKYLASVMSLSLYATFQFFSPDYETLDLAQRSERYIKTVRLLSNTSRGIGDLMLVYKRVAGLAGHTSRVSELMEAVDRLAHETHHESFLRRHGTQTSLVDAASHGSEDGNGIASNFNPPQQIEGDVIAFDSVGVDSPDGCPLVRNLTFSVPPGTSVIVMGPNGSGKSSLFRCLAGLWPHQAGVVTKPAIGSVFYLAQRPYLVSGSLRDQLLYPFPPRAVWAGAGARARNAYPGNPEVHSTELDAKLMKCLEAVELGYLLNRYKEGWGAMKNWQEILSGGEKQRLAMARLLYHNPKYAILDECTSAVSADGEVKLYEAVMAAGITALSIAHRPQLRKFHSLGIIFEGITASTPSGWRAEDLSAEN